MSAIEERHSFEDRGHNGADIGGRSAIKRIIAQGKSATSGSKTEEKIYSYELNRLKEVYKDEQKAKQKLDSELKELSINNPVVAIAPGKVHHVAYDARSGFYVTIIHTEDESVQSKYMHFKRYPLVNPGDYVGAGTLLGYEGDTGRSTSFHCHFEVYHDGHDPCNHIYPVYNPFYNKEKAEAEGYSLESDYMSLYRTVYLAGDESGMVSADSITNITPTRALLDNVEDLLQDQGKIERSSKPLYLKCDLGWTEGKIITADYLDYLESNKLYDLYLEDAFFDKKLAMEQGYLDVPPELYNAIYGNIIVKTDMPGGLPELTEDELRHILEFWLPARYGNAMCEVNGYTNMTKVEYLMNYVFTDENIEQMLEAQAEYKVSIAFALAVATVEQQMGLSNTTICRQPYCNIFSITGTINNGVYMRDRYWNSYLSFGNAFEGFDRLIATKEGCYYNAGDYTIASIGASYCPGSASWINQVTKIVMDIMQYYTGSGWSSPFSPTGSNAELLNAAKNCIDYLKAMNFSYSMGGPRVPPYSSNSGGVWGQPINRLMDCSAYISWVFYEYGLANNIPELINFGRWDTGRFESFCDKLAAGKNDGLYSHFQIVASRKRGDNMSASALKAIMEGGDLILYRQGSAHHIEMLTETGDTRVYSAGDESHWRNPDNVHWTRRTSQITYVFRLIG